MALWQLLLQKCRYNSLLAELIISAFTTASWSSHNPQQFLKCIAIEDLLKGHYPASTHLRYMSSYYNR